MLSNILPLLGLVVAVSLILGIAAAVIVQKRSTSDADGEEPAPNDIAPDQSSTAETVGDEQDGRVLDKPSERQRTAIAPSYIKEDPDHYEWLQLDDKFTRSYFVTEFPERLTPIELNKLFTQAGLDIDVSISVSPIDDGPAKADLKEDIKSLRAEESRLRDDGLRDEADDIAKKKDELKKLRKAIRDHDRSYADVGIYLTVEAPNLDRLTTVAGNVEELLNSLGFSLVLKKKDQERNHRTVTPIPDDEIDMKRSMMDEHVGALMPFVGSTIIQDGGIPLGENPANRTPIIYDRFSHGNGYCWLTVANIGSGKTVSSNLMFNRRFMKDDDTILVLLDPLEGFAGLCDALEGEQVVVGGDRGLNPLEIEPVSEEAMKADPQVDPGGAKLSGLRSFFNSLWKMRGHEEGLGDLWNTLEPVLRDTYLQVGIDLDDPSTFHKDNPTVQENLMPELLDMISSIEDNSALRDFIEDLDDFDAEEIMGTEGMQEALEEERRRAIELLLGMQPFVEGGELDHLGGESQFDIEDNDVVWLDLKMQEGEDSLGLMMTLLFSSVYQRAKDTDKKVIFAIDEARYVMKDKAALDFLEQRVRHSRHYDLSIQFITQTLDEFFSHEKAKHIVDQIAHKLVMRTEGLDDETAEKIGMSPRQAAFARTADEGDEERGYSEAALGISGKGWTPIHISGSDKEMAVADWEAGKPASELPGYEDSQDVPREVKQLTAELDEAYEEKIQEARAQAEEGIPEISVTTPDGEETVTVDSSQLFNSEDAVDNLASQLGIEADGGTETSHDQPQNE